jgi:hypothetical protein
MPVARLALALTVLALVAPAGALAQGSPLAPLPQPLPDTSTAQVQTTSNTPGSTTADSGLGTTGEILLYGTGALLLFGIALLVVRDARRRAPVEEQPAQPRGTASPQRHARARAKAKAAKAQRRRNRARR